MNKIYCYETKECFDTPALAAKHFKTGTSNINRVLDNTNRTIRGNHFCTDLSIFEDVTLEAYSKEGVYCYETREFFNTIAEAKRKYNANDIASVKDVPNRVSGGYHWCTSLDVFNNTGVTKYSNEIYCYETKEKFSSVKAAHDKYRLNNIYMALNDPSRAVGGYHWCTSLDKFDNTELSDTTVKGDQVVYCYETKERFESITEARNKYNATNIYSALDQPNKASGGYHWCTSLDIFDGIILTSGCGVYIYCYETKERFRSIAEAHNKYGNVSIPRVLNDPTKTAANLHWCTDLSIFDAKELTGGPEVLPVYCYETKEYFRSIRAAHDKYGVISISTAKNDANKTAGGYHWCTDLRLLDGKELTYSEPGRSEQERELVRYVISLCGEENIILNSKGIISPLELDIYIPSAKLAIEYNGVYWHSESALNAINKDAKNYHINKTNMCKAKGIQLIHIFEHQWLEKLKIVKSLIKNKLNLNTNNIYARKCEIRIVTGINASAFLYINHMQGITNSSINLGLYYENELVSLMTFSKPRFNKDIEWELNRFCNKLDINVVGGASKLLKYFENNYKPNAIISYANLQWSNGGIYNTLGFELSHQSEPNYWWTKGQKCLSRYKCQKHKLPNLLNNFDPDKTETENMEYNGYSRIYDCGNLTYIKEYQ